MTMTIEHSITERTGYRRLVAKYAGACDSCCGAIAKGDPILYSRRHELRLLCLDCGARADAGEALEHNGPARLTTRERLEAKAEKRLEWGASRAAKATESYASGRAALAVIPFGQPVHGARDQNYRDKATRKLERSWEHSKMAEHHGNAAAGIERALRTSIYDDDPDAIERLEDKIARLEDQRTAIKTRNAEYRKAHPELRALGAYDRDQAMPHRGYELTNLSANINRLRKRLEGLRRQEG